MGIFIVLVFDTNIAAQEIGEGCVIETSPFKNTESRTPLS